MKRMALIIIISSIVAVILVINLYIRLAPQFGKLPVRERMTEFAKSYRYDGKKFMNSADIPVILPKSVLKMLKQQVGKHPGRTPVRPLPSVKPNFDVVKDQDSISVTWLGHSIVLIRISELTILTDPVFSDRASPVSFVGPKPFPVTISITPEELPFPDVILLSHDHFDHLDYRTIRGYYLKVKHFFVPLGLREHLIRWGVPANNIIEFDWWQSIQLADSIQIISAPAQHFSGRRGQNNSTLWCSWIINTPHQKIFFSGDSGYGKHFKEIGEKYGPFDLTLMECGAYGKYWPFIHMIPEESAQAHIDLNGKFLMPIHWGKFNLSFHPWQEPVERLLKEALNLDVKVVTPVIGQPVKVGQAMDPNPWWRE